MWSRPSAPSSLPPYSTERVSFEGLYVVDPPFTLALLGFALASRLRPRQARTLALCGLALMLAYPLAGNLLRLNMQQRYEALLMERGQTWESVRLAPDALAPWYWKVVLARGSEMLVTTATPFNLAEPYPELRLGRVARAELLRLGAQASIFRTYAWFAAHPAELPPAQDRRERRFVDAAFVHSGPVLSALFGQGPGFAQCDALLDEAGRVTAWRDWNGRVHPVAAAPQAGGPPGSALAGQPPRP